MRQGQGLDVWDGLVEHRLRPDGHRPVEDGEARDHDRRHVAVVLNVLGHECVEPIAAAEEDLPIRGLKTPGTELVALQAVGHVVVSECSTPRIEPRYALLGAEPEPAESIFQNAPNAAAGQALAFRVAGERSASPVVPVQSVERSHPQCPGPVFEDRVDAAAVESSRVPRVGGVSHERSWPVRRNGSAHRPTCRPTARLNDPDR